MNSKGLVVKDKYLKSKALNISKRLKFNDFSCSGGGFISNFKKRNNLVSRAQTSCRLMPSNAKELALEFINTTRALIKSHDIKPKNILNFDQVPRYFEQENSKTLTVKGSKNVLLSKASTSHSRFTFTPIISADGNFVGKHCLFSNLKKVPKDTNKNVYVDVNKTGMWSEELTCAFFEKYILSRRETRFAKDPVLVIIDSFSAHLKLDGRYNDRNVFVMFVPKGMTPLLQMLDVSINRSFQQYYGDRINEWMVDAIEDEGNRTKSGNIKRPSYKQVTDICHDFSKKIDSAMRINSFEICGILGDNFDIDRLHGPLKKLLLGEEIGKLTLYMKTSHKMNLRLT